MLQWYFQCKLSFKFLVGLDKKKKIYIYSILVNNEVLMLNLEIQIIVSFTVLVSHNLFFRFFKINLMFHPVAFLFLPSIKKA